MAKQNYTFGGGKGLDLNKLLEDTKDTSTGLVVNQFTDGSKRPAGLTSVTEKPVYRPFKMPSVNYSPTVDLQKNASGNMNFAPISRPVITPTPTNTPVVSNTPRPVTPKSTGTAKGLNAEQISQLDAAYLRGQTGQATATNAGDKANIEYAMKTYGYKPPVAPVTPEIAPVTPNQTLGGGTAEGYGTTKQWADMTPAEQAAHVAAGYAQGSSSFTPPTPTGNQVVSGDALYKMQVEAAAGGLGTAPRPILDINGNPTNAIDQYYSGLNTKPKTYEQLREEERKSMQAQIDVINELYNSEMAKLKEVNKGRLNETSSIAVGAGLAGSPFQGAQEDKTKAFNTQEEQALRAKQAAEIAQAMGLADSRAVQRAQLEMQQANMDRTEYIGHLKDIQADARTSFINLAKSGKTKLTDLSADQLKKLMDDTGLDSLQLESMYNANLPAKDKVTYEYKELKDGTLMRLGSNGEQKIMGNYAPPTEEKGWEVKEMGGMMYWVNPEKKQFELIGASGNEKAPDVKSINGVDSTYNSATGTWEPVKTPSTSDNSTVLGLQDKIKTIEGLKTHAGLNNAVGSGALGRLGDAFSGQKESFIGQVEQIISAQTMQSLLNLKKAGGTLGALSDGERQMLQNAASQIGQWSIKDDSGKVKGYDIDEESFKKELDTLKTLTQRALDQADKSGQANDPLGLGYTQFNGVVSQENPLGFNKVGGDTNTATGITKAKVLGDSWVDPNTKDDVECVIYARTFAPGLPKMPYSDTDKNYNAEVKRSKINSDVPQKGAVAIMPNVGFYGHVAGIKEILPDGRLRIREANYQDGKITERVGTPQELGIEGYWVDNQNNLA